MLWWKDRDEYNLTRTFEESTFTSPIEKEPTPTITWTNVWPEKILVFRLLFKSEMHPAGTSKGTKGHDCNSNYNYRGAWITFDLKRSSSLWEFFRRRYSSFRPLSPTLLLYFSLSNYNYDEKTHRCRCGVSFFHLETVKQERLLLRTWTRRERKRERFFPFATFKARTIYTPFISVGRMQTKFIFRWIYNIISAAFATDNSTRNIRRSPFLYIMIIRGLLRRESLPH